jgi:hypothetical protein
MTENNKIDESILIGKTLSLIAIGVTTSFEKFSGWLLAGFGAAFALLLSNIETVAKFIAVEDIKTGVLLYLIALASGVFQRWLAAGINAGAMVSKEAEDLGANAPEGIDFDNVLTQIENSTFYPQKWLVRYQFNQVRKNDYAAPGRMQATMAQIQGRLVLVQGVLVISSIVVMVRGLSA